MDEEYRRYGDSTILEPILEQQDDEMTTSPMSSSSIEMNHFEEEQQRVLNEIEQFEELEKQCSVQRRGVRVKFDLSPIAQTTVIQTEPFFQVNSTEDQVTKHFYHNEFPIKDSINNEQDQPSATISVKTLSEQDSLEEEQDEGIVLSSPGKSILKRSSKETSKKRHASSSPSHSDSNEMVHLAEVTGKQTTSQCSRPLRSLFEPTINIFDTSSISNQSRRPSRLRYYIKPYRGETYIPPQTTQPRSRSLSDQRLTQHSSGSTVWYTFTNQYNRKQHVSWSPVRDYIHQGRDKSSKHQNKLSRHSSSNPCLRTSSSSSSQVTPSYSSQNSPSSLPSLPHNEEKKIISSLPDIVHPSHGKDRSETMQRYDRLLEKMRATDEQLRMLSKSWTNNIKEQTIVTRNKTMKNEKEMISPMIVQMCLLILVCFNLLVVYFFNEINLLWTRYVSHRVIVEQHGGETSKF